MQIFDFVTFNPVAGCLVWKSRPREHFSTELSFRSWNTKYAYTRVGSNASQGGRRQAVTVTFQRKTLHAHRIIWEMHHGPIPKSKCIDHVDGDAWNNRLENLRLATRSQNSMNYKRPSSNTSGLKGAVKHKGSKKWMAQIKCRGETIYLGLHETAQLAHRAYCAAAEKFHGSFSRVA